MAASLLRGRHAGQFRVRLCSLLIVNQVLVRPVRARTPRLGSGLIVMRERDGCGLGLGRGGPCLAYGGCLTLMRCGVSHNGMTVGWHSVQGVCVMC